MCVCVCQANIFELQTVLLQEASSTDSMCALGLDDGAVQSLLALHSPAVLSHQEDEVFRVWLGDDAGVCVLGCVCV